MFSFVYCVWVIVFVIIALCIVLSVYVLFCVFVFVVYCIVLPLPPATYPLAVNNNNINTH
jgi:hypothetical protein